MRRRVRRAVAYLARRLRGAWTAGQFALVSVIAAVLWSVAAAAPAAGTSSVKPAEPVVMKPSVPSAGTPFGGTPAVGALFTISDGKLGMHFCTASVAASAAGDLLVTAAHCVSGYSAARPANLAFVPGYDNGTAPYGVWVVTRILVDSAWSSGADPDDDLAFLVVAPHGGNMSIEDVTGAERLSASQPSAGTVRVIGYPDTQNQPISCQNAITAFEPGQLEFDCADFTDGTSGGPFLIDVDPATGNGTVVGVIGGYQQGGDSPAVSYAAMFGQNVLSLYVTARWDSARPDTAQSVGLR
jgi:V8-like Glu-specific endopeptidase